MSLIQPVDPIFTPCQAAAVAIREQVQRVHRAMVLGQIDIFKAVWKSADYTPQQVLDELGADAAQLFQLGAANVGTILSIDPAALTEADWKPPFVVTMNQDGTVVVTDQPNP